MDWHDGREITELMRSRKMSGISSQVMIDQAGNRYGDYALLAMVENDEQQFKFKVLWNYIALLSTKKTILLNPKLNFRRSTNIYDQRAFKIT